VHEKEFILDAIDEGKKVLGICLGSQLLANCLGAKVYRNPEPEIGWFPVKKKFFMHSWFPVFDENEKVQFFHWHGDTFDIPEGGVPLFESEGCRNQAFAIEDQVLALQFHPEIAEEDIMAFIENARGDLRPARFIQSEVRMLSNCKLYGEASKTFLYDLLYDFFTE
jgi:GMP synthase-like glutamine amidotransferase